MSQSPLKSQLFSEFIGTAALLCAVIGSGIMAVNLSGGNDGVALLANTLATVFALYVLIEVLGPVSGAHFNPLVTLVMLFMAPKEAADQQNRARAGRAACACRQGRWSGGLLHRRGVLVHVKYVVCQPGGGVGADAVRQLRRHCAR